ncbi:glycosyltransferase family 4 protein [Luminiphilus sp.]|nr:glycosyltransferase family 4 protein [Luminiphilus sp.]
MLRVLLVSNLVYDAQLVSEGGNARYGGWLTATAAALTRKGICVGFVFRDGPTLEVEGQHEVKYFCLEYSEPDFNFGEILQRFKPDVLHCEGTEYPHNRFLIENSELPLLLSMQGILFGIDRYFMGELLSSRLVSLRSPYSYFVYFCIFCNYQILFKRRIKSELEMLAKVSRVVGRTEWDAAYSGFLAPNAQYHSINRIIRQEFFERRWRKNSKSQSIFIGNCSRPLKGFHTVLEASLLLREKFDELKIYVAGPSPFENRGIKGYVDYMFLVKQFIIKHDLHRNFVFMGTIDAECVAETMCDVSCVVVSSFIENSPNTLAEAMFMGVPTISSFVGGSGSMLSHEQDGLMFRAGDEIMLAAKVSSVFTDASLAHKLSESAYVRARREHDVDSIVERYEHLYSSII